MGPMRPLGFLMGPLKPMGPMIDPLVGPLNSIGPGVIVPSAPPLKGLAPHICCQSLSKKFSPCLFALRLYSAIVGFQWVASIADFPGNEFADP